MNALRILNWPNDDIDVFTAWKKIHEEIDLINDDLGGDFGDDEKKEMIEERI